MSQKKRILFVDDEPDLLITLRMNLQRHGYDVVSAMDGEDGFKRALEMHPDLILTDYVLPKMDGIELCEKIRSCEGELREVPIIIMSALKARDVESKCLDAGANAFLRKPYSKDDLLNLIADLIDK